MGKNKVPDWSKSPEWAMFAAMDRDGSWLWYEYEVRYSSSKWVFHAQNGKSEYVQDFIQKEAKSKDVHAWETLQKRPA